MRLTGAFLLLLVVLGLASPLWFPEATRAQGSCPAARCLYLPAMAHPLPVTIRSSRVAEQGSKGGGSFTLVSGTLLNLGPQAVYEIEVQAEFYDASGGLLHSATTLALLPATAPNESNYFTLIYPQSLPAFDHYRLTVRGWHDVSAVDYRPATLVSQEIRNPPDGYSYFLVTVRNDQPAALDNVVVLYETDSGYATLQVGTLAVGETKTFTSPLTYPRIRQVWQAQGALVPTLRQRPQQ
jgi:hypothetical protein